MVFSQIYGFFPDVSMNTLSVTLIFLLTRITEADFMLANRRAARLEEIAEHGRPVSFRKAVHKSKKVYDRKRLKRMEQKFSDKSEFTKNRLHFSQNMGIQCGIMCIFVLCVECIIRYHP